MEASKCPKCGEEPSFIEHIEKWYCFGCNSYIDVSEEKHVCAGEQPSEECASAIEHELKSLDDEKVVCKHCGAELQGLKDGRLYCFMCETYQDEIPEEKEAEVPAENESQKLLDSVAAVPETKTPEPVVPTEPVVETKPEPIPVVAEPIKEPEPVLVKEPEPKPVEVKMCQSCGQPLKFIDKYQRYYCYGCRKYASKDEPPKAAPVVEVKQEEHKKCPDCGAELKFIDKYSEHYCYVCKKYPLRAPKKTEPVKSEPSSGPKVLSCPKCGEPVKWVEKYSRHYCYKCKEYAPKGFGGTPVDSSEKKTCPACSEDMKFIPEYNEWYCYKCKRYSLRPSKPILLF